MTEYTLTYKKNTAFENYLRELFSADEIAEIAYEEANAVMTFHGVKERVFRRRVAEAVTLFDKFYTVKEIYDESFSGVFSCAYLGSVIAQELEREIQTVEKRIPKSQHLNANGMKMFLMREQEYAWKALALLSKQLYRQCMNEDDLIALMKYFIGGSVLTDRTVVMSGGLYFDDTNEDIPLVRFFSDEDENAAFNLLRLSPAEILVPAPKNYSVQLLSLIKKLGE